MLVETLIAGGALFAIAKRWQQCGDQNGHRNHSTAVKKGSQAAGNALAPAGKARSPSGNAQLSVLRALQRLVVTPEGKVRSDAEKRVDRDLAISTALVIVAGVGALVVSPALVFATVPGFLYLSYPICKRACKQLAERRVTIDTLLAISVVTAFSAGFVFVVGLTYVLYYVAEKLMLRVKDDSKKCIVDVFEAYPSFAWVRIGDEVEVRTAVDQLTVDDVVVVDAGGTIPVDGTITEGIASIDQHILTGESQCVEKVVGDQVFASTVVLSGRIYVQVEKAGKDTTVARIGDILNNTTDFTSSAELKAESLANRTVLPTLLLSGGTLPFIGPAGSIAVLQAHFNYRMGLVAPVSILSHFALMSDRGILMKDGRSLDLLNQIDTIVFDKTGTLTCEQPDVGKIVVCDPYRQDEIVYFAAAAEQKQTHPIAKAILEEAINRQLDVPNIDHADYKIGYGLVVEIAGKKVRVGSRRFIETEGIVIPSFINRAQDSCHVNGNSLVLVAVGDELAGMIELVPAMRPEARRVVSRLRKRKKIQAMYIISGDHETPTKALAENVGIDHYFSETLPQQKAELIDRLQKEGKSVCFIGDGINDAIAMKKAKVSVSLRGASTVATDTAGVVLMDGSLEALVTLFEIAEGFHENINVGFKSLLVPSLIGMGGAIFLNFSLFTVVMLTQVGLVVGVLNGVRPRVEPWLERRRIRSSATELPLLPRLEERTEMRMTPCDKRCTESLDIARN